MSTASEIFSIQREAGKTMARELAMMDNWNRKTWVYFAAAHLLGNLAKPHNRSPKPLARLKHSMTRLALGPDLSLSVNINKR